MKWKVRFFQTSSGRYPVEEFIKDQDESTYARILRFVELLQDEGPYLKPPYIKKISAGLYELRIKGKTSVRIFYTIVREEYYLLHAYKKEGQKTPRKELKTALDRMGELI